MGYPGLKLQRDSAVRQGNLVGLSYESGKLVAAASDILGDQLSDEQKGDASIAMQIDILSVREDVFSPLTDIDLKIAALSYAPTSFFARLFARSTYKGRPLLRQIDPQPVAVYGNMIAFTRITSEPGDTLDNAEIDRLVQAINERKPHLNEVLIGRNPCGSAGRVASIEMGQSWIVQLWGRERKGRHCRSDIFWTGSGRSHFWAGSGPSGIGLISPESDINSGAG